LQFGPLNRSLKVAEHAPWRQSAPPRGVGAPQDHRASQPFGASRVFGGSQESPRSSQPFRASAESPSRRRFAPEGPALRPTGLVGAAIDLAKLVALGAASFTVAAVVLGVRTGRFVAVGSHAGDGGASADPVHASMNRPAAAVPPVERDPALPPGAQGAPIPADATAPARVGILAGHWQYDSGAVCADGLREVDVTTDVATRVEALLEGAGYDVEILPEHDPDVPGPPVSGYEAAAFVAVHADSCEVPGASGFKVARFVGSSTPDQDDRLVACLESRYASATLLPQHDDSITANMTYYYALREIAPLTPGAIIELGFLLEDRAFLDAHRYEAAVGIADGVRCFLEGD
jgi:N-acetylmuramoyl-L-alanine amidase